MVIMTHVGDPDTWYHGKYADTAKYGTRDEHYRDVGRRAAKSTADTPWVGAHMGGNPEDLGRLQRLLDKFPNLIARLQRDALDGPRDQRPAATRPASSSSATPTASSSAPTRSAATTAASTSSPAAGGPTASSGRPPTSAPCPILDPDLPPDQQPDIRGLALPDDVLQKIYHDNALKVLARIGRELRVKRSSVATRLRDVLAGLIRKMHCQPPPARG